MDADGLDACLGLVADRHRRRLVEELRRAPDGEADISTIVDRMCADRDGSDDAAAREQLAVRLFHVHLPKLEAFGAVEYDLDRGTIEYRYPERLETVMDALPREVPASSA
jgi:hypothetical protein